MEDKVTGKKDNILQHEKLNEALKEGRYTDPEIDNVMTEKDIKRA